MFGWKENKNERGDTMIEAMLAIALIVMTLVGFLSLSSFNYLKGKETFNRNIAINLAREGVEIIRNVRDSNWMHGCPSLDPQDSQNCWQWDTWIGADVSTRLIPYFEPDHDVWQFSGRATNDDLNTCVQNENCLLWFSDEGIYGLNGTPSKFYRLIETNPICADSADCGGDGICQNGDRCLSERIGMQVVSLVRWSENSGVKNVRQEERLYNWR